MHKLLKRLTAVRSWSAGRRCWFPAGRFVPPPGCAEPSRWAGTLRCALRVSAAKTTEALTARSLSLCLPVSLPHPLSLLPSFSNSHVLFLPLLLIYRFSSFSVSPLTSHSVCFLPPCWRSLFLFSVFIWFKCSLLTLTKVYSVFRQQGSLWCLQRYPTLLDVWKNTIADWSTR